MISGRRFLARVLIAAAPLLLAPLAPGAADAPAWDFVRLMAELAQVQTSEARYSEVRHVAMLQRPLELSGTLRYTRPARIEKLQTRPFRELVRVDEDTLTLERDGKTRSVVLRNVPLVGALVESLRATLAGDATELERLYHVSMDGSREGWRLKLTPREIEVAGIVREINISGAGARVGRIEILESGGDRSVMTIREAS